MHAPMSAPKRATLQLQQIILILFFIKKIYIRKDADEQHM
jgi:hypothetical protein